MHFQANNKENIKFSWLMGAFGPRSLKIQYGPCEVSFEGPIDLTKLKIL